MSELAPFKVAEIVVTSLEALLSAAALHLGEALPDGRQLAPIERDPIEAWMALLSASALVEQMGRYMRDDLRQTFEGKLQALVTKLAANHADRQFPVPAPVVSSLTGLVDAAFGKKA
ncbi:MAG: hypothetical protein JWM80_211 [Cyanobacteria bacterium RYN_339]|nr:hypothetical protein [Cyanobacteria bacterium RYN_339]